MNDKEKGLSEQTVPASDTGKFNSTAQLLDAYNALEREFTKRCQLVKQLQAALASHEGAQASALAAEKKQCAPADTASAEMSAPPDRECAAAAEKTQCAPADTAPAEMSAPPDRECAAAAEKTQCAPAEAALAPEREEPARPVPSSPADAQVAALCARDADRAAIVDEIAAHATDYAELLSELPQIMDACITRYKQKLLAFSSAPSPRGMAVIVPTKRPRSLAEAKQLADSMLS